VHGSEAAVRVLFVAAMVCLLPSCGGPPPPPEGNHNLLLITLDTVRTDFLEPYGFPESSSPNLARLAATSLVFEQAFATSPRTGPSHASILTSLHPAHHGVLFNGIDLPQDLDAGSVTLAEHLGRQGFYSGGIVSVSALGRSYGFHRGFDTFEHERTRRKDQRPEAGGGADCVSETAVAWLKKHRDRRFFLWVHYYEAHAPYNCEPRTWEALGVDPEPPVTMETLRAGEHSAEQIRTAYRAEIFELDHYVGRLLGALEELDLDPGTLVAVVSDHGEFLGEHGMYGHQELYDEVLHVPMMIRQPLGSPGRRRDLVSIVDLAPTLLAMLGTPPLPGAQGRNLSAPVEPGDERNIYAEWRHHAPYLDERKPRPKDVQVGVRSPSTKLIYDLLFPGHSEFYDLGVDSGEQINLIGGRAPSEADDIPLPVLPALFESGLTESLEQYLEGMPYSARAVAGVSFGPETVEMLEALGYLEGGG